MLSKHNRQETEQKIRIVTVNICENKERENNLSWETYKNVRMCSHLFTAIKKNNTFIRSFFLLPADFQSV